MPDLVQPNAWVVIKLASESNRILQVAPNTTISLGKYGAFPSNLIIQRPYHITYEVQDKREGESFSRLRVVPASELHADVLAEEDGQKPIGADEDANSGTETPAGADETNTDNVIAVQDGDDYTLVDKASGNVLARTGLDEARQLLTMDEIETLKKQDADSGRDIIARLMLSHTALGEKTAFSLAKYKILKSKKYLRRFSVLPLHPVVLAQYVLEDKDASKVLEMRQEALGLLGSWSNVHYSESPEDDTRTVVNDGNPVADVQTLGRRYLVVDDTGGLVVASLAERMGILWPESLDGGLESEESEDQNEGDDKMDVEDSAAPSTEFVKAPEATTENGSEAPERPKRSFRDDFEVDVASSNTITVLHQAAQPNLAFLRYWGCDLAAPNLCLRDHPLLNRLLPVSWLQLLEPECDTTYSNLPEDATPEEMESWKSNRRGNYHRKRKRWARTRFIVDQARAGGFSSLVVASTMDLTSILRTALPLLAGGASISIYSPTIEPLTELCDCFSITRRGAWTSNPPPETEGMTPAELERWQGSEDFPINPTLLLGAAVQTSRAKRWQVLPMRTHPLMMAKGGAEGYIFTGWKAVPAVGKVEARGKFKKRKIEAQQAEN